MARRRFLRLIALGSGATLLAACAQPAPPHPTTTPAERATGGWRAGLEGKAEASRARRLDPLGQGEDVLHPTGGGSSELMSSPPEHRRRPRRLGEIARPEGENVPTSGLFDARGRLPV